VFGQEAHIVARSPGGPRAGSYAGDIDGYDNLILLCSKCHKQVDDQVNTYTVDELLKIKRDHEARVAKLGEKPKRGGRRLVPDPAHPLPKTLKLFTSGTAFYRYFAGWSYSFTPGWPEGLSDEHEDLIAEFLQDVNDWLLDAGGDSYTTAREASKVMQEHIDKLGEAGFLLGARRRHLLLTDDSDIPPDPWRDMVIEIYPTSLAVTLMVDEDGQPLKFGQEG
jgi:hypothetical protein